MQLEAVGAQGVQGLLVALLHQAPDLGVHLLRGTLGAGELGAAAQVAVALLAQGHHAELV